MSRPPVTSSGTSAARWTTSVSGPGQKRASVCAARDVDGPLVELFRTREMHDDGVIGRPALDRVETTQRVAVRRVGAEPVDGLRRERDESTLLQDRDGTRDFRRAHQ